MEVDVEMQCQGEPVDPVLKIRAGGNGEPEEPSAPSNPLAVPEQEPTVEVQIDIEEQKSIPIGEL